ncbi:uncharacterized protein LOC109853273 isoform X2 [Pseudomyrmex gracilis]|uniref:uncharacterized protein LOC109853273 isoform X2 n=1 Tax=Pseudomyrmex gracilis TaxID=219809 RepID=UPI00099552C4|nr:uncharacterized protein LOC109853273 isoform X2 [Pseudomyrmex gracilis]
MGTSRQEDRSLGSGISLPQWMKGKIDNRYPKTQNSEAPQEGLKRMVNDVLKENNIKSSSSQTITSETSISNLNQAKTIDFSKHPLPCQPFIPAAKPEESKIQKTPGNIKLKSQGTDDGFHGEPALCGKSIVHVANQMMSGKLTKLFTSESRSQQAETSLKSVSKSLPATPLTSPTGTPDSSPKARRKVHANRYFTGAFIPDKEKYQGNWILSSILGQSREVITAKIEEEDEHITDWEPRKPLSRKKSISSQNLTYIGKEEKSVDKTPIYLNVLEAKPSELREMNFWSPTSM